MKKLNENESVVTAYAESADGPGYGNAPIWVIIRHKITGEFRRDCIQPEEQTGEMRILYGISQVTHSAMTNAVFRAVTKAKQEPTP